jgi:hypothetical protein
MLCLGRRDPRLACRKYVWIIFFGITILSDAGDRTGAVCLVVYPRGANESLALDTRPMTRGHDMYHVVMF